MNYRPFHPNTTDLGAERLIVAEQGTTKIAVEVKCFNQNSDINEFHSALGQYINYNIALSEQEPDRLLYLAIPYNTYITFFTRRFIESVIERNQVKLIILILMMRSLSNGKIKNLSAGYQRPIK